MKYLVHFPSKAIAGMVDPANANSIPENYTQVEGPDAPDVSFVYLDSSVVKLKPPSPGTDYVWTGDKWIKRFSDTLPFKLGPDWDGLTTALRGTAFFAKAYNSAKTSLPANVAFTLFLVTVTASHSLPDLLFSITDLRTEMKKNVLGGGDFSASELTAMNLILKTYNFEINLTDAGTNR